MAGDKEPFMGPRGRPCTVYVEHEGTFEGVALGQEQSIKVTVPIKDYKLGSFSLKFGPSASKAAGGIVTKVADEAAVVVVIERTEKIEQRIRDTCKYRMTDPVTQAVVDWVWVYDCIKKSELQGPPNWGGHLLRPKEQGPAITRDKAREVAIAIFGQPQAVEHEAVTGEPDAMQLDPAPAAGRSGATSRDDTQEEEPRGRRMTGSNNKGPRTELEDMAWDEVKRLIEEEYKERRSRTFSSDDMEILVDGLYEFESTSETDERWWEGFAKDHQWHSIDSWREFYRNRSGVVNKCVNILLSVNPGTGDTLRPLRDHSATTTSRYRNRSRSGGRNSNRTGRKSDKQPVGTIPDALASERSSNPSGAEPSVQPKKRGRPPKQPASEPKTPTQAKKNGTVVRPQRSSSRIRSASGGQVQVASPVTLDHHGAVGVSPYSSSDAHIAMKFFSSYDKPDLLTPALMISPGRKAAFDALMRAHIAADPKRSPGSEGDTWTSWLKNDWDVISAGALALKGKAEPNRTAQIRLSSRNETFTAHDYDDMADFIANQIQARNVVKGGEMAALTQDFVWKAFAIAYQTDRAWTEWQTYYREHADAINGTARKRLDEAQVALEMQQLAISGMLNAPPLRVVLKRPLEGQSDERHSKQLRL